MAQPLGTPPGPSGGLSLLGVLSEFRKDPVEFLLNTSRKFGDVTSFRLGLRRTYLICRPDLIEEVLVHGSRYFTRSSRLQPSSSLLGESPLASEGESHRPRRKLIEPAFDAGQLPAQARIIVEQGERLAAGWNAGDSVDVEQEMLRVSFGISGTALFGEDFEAEAAGLKVALNDISATFEAMFLPFATLLNKVSMSASARRALAAGKYLDNTIYGLIRKRREAARTPDDLLSVMLDSPGGAPKLTDQQIRDHAVTLLLRGHEMTAAALTWTWYLLSRNPLAAERFRAELREVLGERAPGFDDVPRLIYTERVFSESLRLYPPAWRISRTARSQFRLFNYLVPKDALCIMSPYVTHRLPRFWPNPEKFDPGRWTPEAREGRPRFAYFPFGGGPGSCTGERLAWTTAILLLATIGRHWRLNYVPSQPAELLPGVILRPRNGMPMKTERVLG
jgi:cytochrome P450